MLRKAFLSYLTASMITIIVIMIELGFRSAVVSPFVLLDSNKESNPKVFVAHSLYQGDVNLSRRFFQWLFRSILSIKWKVHKSHTDPICEWNQ